MNYKIYGLIEWPDSQQLMEYEWFSRECIAIDYQRAFFVPIERLEQLGLFYDDNLTEQERMDLRRAKWKKRMEKQNTAVMQRYDMLPLGEEEQEEEEISEFLVLGVACEECAHDRWRKIEGNSYECIACKLPRLITERKPLFNLSAVREELEATEFIEKEIGDYHIYHSLSPYKDLLVQPRKHVGSVEAYTLEQARRKTQNGLDGVDKNWNPDSPQRSTTKGDVIMEDLRYYMVTDTGFIELSDVDMRNSID